MGSLNLGATQFHRRNIVKKFLVQEVVYHDRYVEAEDEDAAYSHVKYSRKQPESEVLQPSELLDGDFAPDTEFEKVEEN
jgi:hypothetical protein